MVLDPKRSDVAIKQLQSSVASIKKNQTRIDAIQGNLDATLNLLNDEKNKVQPIELGGTGATNVDDAQNNLGVAISEKTMKMFADAGYPIGTGTPNISDGSGTQEGQTGGTSNYEELTNLPFLDGVKIIGNVREQDPTVPTWAKASIKPTYKADEVGAVPESAVISIEELQQLFNE